MDWRSFVHTWQTSTLGEKQAAQTHFLQLCELTSAPRPGPSADGRVYTFEAPLSKLTSGAGFADVWRQGHFVWEYKGKGKDLDAAYQQVRNYADALDNPPLLIVSDFDRYRIYPNFPGLPSIPFEFSNTDLLDREKQDWITWALTEPARFRALRDDEQRKRAELTEQRAADFARLQDAFEGHYTPHQTARFLTRLLFLLFAEDVRLIPEVESKSLFRFILDQAAREPAVFKAGLTELFHTMAGGSAPSHLYRHVPYFDGGLFDPEPDEGGVPEVLDLALVLESDAVAILRAANEADWRRINPSILGTLFERALDTTGKRKQLGAHYTGEKDIRLVLDPVLMRPLLRQWEDVRQQAAPLLVAFEDDRASARVRAETRAALLALHGQMLDVLAATTVLDPACGSGNFLYMSLRLLKDLEGEVRRYFAALNPPFRDVVTPRQLFGIEVNEFAARLAQVALWIGYLQWRYEAEGELLPHRDGVTDSPRTLPNPILSDSSIFNADAILRFPPLHLGEGSGVRAYEPEWPPATVIVGNPPFLGDKKMRVELGDEYVEALRKLYKGRVPGGADLVTYWFEKARAQIEAGKAGRAGLVATQSIRTGASRQVLDRINETGAIFEAHSDRRWIQDGAAVRISIVCFDAGVETDRRLDKIPVEHINSDLQGAIDVATVQVLSENQGLAFQGPVKVGPFDIDARLAAKMLSARNASGVDNRLAVRPWVNGQDITDRSSHKWIVDFGEMTEVEAAQFEMPFEYVRLNVKPKRDENNRQRRRERWWQHGETVPGLRRATLSLRRFIATPRVAKHRVFVWVATEVLPDSRVVAICRDDDFTFGVLHSLVHESWALRLGAWHGDGDDGGRPTYTPTTTFETFPFPWPPGREDTASPHHAAISAAAAALHAEREAWLNPPDLLAMPGAEDSKALKERTLTNLYNALVKFRDSAAPEKPTAAAREFAPRLAALHDALDRAVLAAYGWLDLADSLRTPAGSEELLRRLLALNHERART